MNQASKPADLHIVILAAGEGTRMHSSQPKVLQPLGGRPMLAHLLETARSLDPARIHLVYGSGADAVREHFSQAGDLEWVLQEDRLGTGHAVQQAMPGIPDEATVLVLYGDHPLVPAEVLRDLGQGPAGQLRVVTMILDDPTGYGRLTRDRLGRITGIVEEKDATSPERAIREVNTGILLSDAAQLRGWLARISNNNAQGEYYLTDVFALAHDDGIEIAAVTAPEPRDLMGANHRCQLAALERRFQGLQAARLMAAGVTLMDPARLDVRGQVEVGRDVVIDVNVVLEGRVVLGDGVRIGAGSVLRDTELGAGSEVHPQSVLDGVVTGKQCALGPFARLRPGTRLGDEVKIGNFVETKNIEMGDGSKASHLSYLGDAGIGQQVNIGAGTITCNYDGVNKHRTEIGDGVFIGSDTQLVAPVSVGEGATVGAGSTITRDVQPGELAISRARQTSYSNWRRPKKKDS